MGGKEGSGWKRKRKEEEGPEMGNYQWVLKQSYDRETDSLITPLQSSCLSYFSCLAYSLVKMETGISET